MKRDNSYINGSKCINTVFTTTRLMEFLYGSKMIDFNKILFTYYREYIVDVSLKDYFSTKGNYLYKIDTNRLNSRRLSYCTRFIKKLDKLL